VNINTYNQYFWVFYVIEIVIMLYFIIATVFDTFIVTICLVIIVQYKVLEETFAKIGPHYEPDKKSKLKHLI